MLKYPASKLKMRETTKIKSGRPPKFTGPRRHVTVTLPERTLATLERVDPDRARAIVKVTEASGADASRRTTVEVVEVAPGLGIIIVGPSQVLLKIRGLRLVEVAPARFLLAIPPGTSIDSLEVSFSDLLDDMQLEDWERPLLSRLRDLIRRIRRQGVVSKAEMLFIDTRAMGEDNSGEQTFTRQETAHGI
jgi:hypothetical protein